MTMNASSGKKMINHSAHYFIGQILLLIASFISFPIFTRIFSVSDYGTMSILNSTILFGFVIAKLGAQNSPVRFYQEFKSGKRKRPIQEFYSTIIFPPLSVGLVIALLLIIVPKILSSKIFDDDLANLLAFVSILVPVRCVWSAYFQFLRAEQKVKLYNLLFPLITYSQLVLSLFFIFFIAKNLYGLFYGHIIVQGLASIYILFMLFKKRLINLKCISFPFLKESMLYGIPLFGLEIGADLLNYGDRFIIRYFLTPEQLGIYSVGYNLAIYVSSLVILPLRSAIMPIYIDIWTNQGEAKTKVFLTKTLRHFMAVAIPVSFGLAAIGKEIIALLASNKYNMSAALIPYIISGLMIYGLCNIFGAGLHIYKRTHLLMVMVFITVFINIILNIVYVPHFGIMAAAVNTLICYMISLIFIVITSFRLLSFEIDFKNIFLYALYSIVMFFVITNINVGNQVINLSLKIGSGLITYALLILLFDLEIRKMVVLYISKMSFFLSRVKLVSTERIMK